MLVRYSFPGRKIVDSLVDLPFALPTAVAGITLTTIYAPNGLLGEFLEPYGIRVAFTRLGVIVALVVFGIGLCVIFLFERFGSRKRPEAWHALTGELFVVGSILVPALIGARTFAAALLSLGILAAREMWRVQRAARRCCRSNLPSVCDSDSR